MAIVTRFTLENATAEVQGVTLTYGEILAKFSGVRLGEEINDATVIEQLASSRLERDENGFFEVDAELNLCGKTAFINEFELAVLVNYDSKAYAFALELIEDDEE